MEHLPEDRFDRFIVSGPFGTLIWEPSDEIIAELKQVEEDYLAYHKSHLNKSLVSVAEQQYPHMYREACIPFMELLTWAFLGTMAAKTEFDFPQFVHMMRDLLDETPNSPTRAAIQAKVAIASVRRKKAA